jgi:transcriptional regulator with XRE-family HTH domain
MLEKLSDYIQLARLKKKLSTAQVAELAGMGRTTLVKIEMGHHSSGVGQ